jgi:tRNA (cmo5U34)-methyltransferase
MTGSWMSSFSDAEAVSAYAKMAARNVPALGDLHRMVGLLLAEKVPRNGRVLVLGAGGGLELKAMAGMHTGWHFDGVDPSAPMLDQARAVADGFADRIELYEGYIEDAPDGPYDGATCLLTLHFLPAAERVRTLKELHRRLRPGAPLVTAHHSFPNNDAEKEKWLTRFATYVATSETGISQTKVNVQAMKERLPILSPDQDVSAMHQAGFPRVELFYAALTFKGWVGYKGGPTS